MGASRWKGSDKAVEQFARSTKGTTETEEGKKMNPIYQYRKWNDKTEEEKRDLELASKILGFIINPFILWAAWNICIPALFGLPPIGYVYSLALYTLVKIIK